MGSSVRVHLPSRKKHLTGPVTPVHDENRPFEGSSREKRTVGASPSPSRKARDLSFFLIRVNLCLGIPRGCMSLSGNGRNPQTPVASSFHFLLPHSLPFFLLFSPIIIYNRQIVSSSLEIYWWDKNLVGRMDFYFILWKVVELFRKRVFQSLQTIFSYFFPSFMVFKYYTKYHEKLKVSPTKNDASKLISSHVRTTKQQQTWEKKKR